MNPRAIGFYPSTCSHDTHIQRALSAVSHLSLDVSRSFRHLEHLHSGPKGPQGPATNPQQEDILTSSRSCFGVCASGSRMQVCAARHAARETRASSTSTTPQHDFIRIVLPRKDGLKIRLSAMDDFGSHVAQRTFGN